jgi:hypothetical protein
VIGVLTLLHQAAMWLLPVSGLFCDHGMCIIPSLVGPLPSLYWWRTGL